MMIKKTSFKHGWWYHYRVHTKKANELTSSFPELKDFLEKMFTECPHEHFESGPRGSKMRVKVPVDTLLVNGHEVSSLTSAGLEENETRYNSGHSKVQMYMIEKDSTTIAMEVPLWMMPDEIESDLFNLEGPLTGHIDLLRIEDGKIWVWDYKPKAAAEKYASTQVYLYAYMLSKRTGIPLENFRCGYFDEFDAFIFKPSLSALKCSLSEFS